jgi:hypothetical protein
MRMPIVVSSNDDGSRGFIGLFRPFRAKRSRLFGSIAFAIRSGFEPRRQAASGTDKAV